MPGRRYRPVPATTSGPQTTASVTAGWKDLIENDKVVPFIGGSLDHAHLAKEPFRALIQCWAETNEISYPWPEQATLTLVAQYLLMKDSESNARVKYLAFLKKQMFDRAEHEYQEHQAKVSAGQADPSEGISDIQLMKAREKIDDPSYSLTDLVYDLGCLDPFCIKDHPLRALASLPFKIFITTSYHRFLEVALFQVGKQPVSEVYHWNSRIGFRGDSIFETDPNFTPTIQRPLVYHLFGWDRQPESLSLSESDYLNWLINLYSERGGTQVGNNINADGKLIVQGFPSVVSNLLLQPGSAPLLLGYDLDEWDFRVLFRGLILATRQVYSGEGIILQQLRQGAKDETLVKASLEKYMKDASRLKIYWGMAGDCLKELDKALK
jgi:hypothetical protein